MKTLDIIMRTKIQGRVESFVVNNMDDNGFVDFEPIKKSIIAEFGDAEEIILEAKKQYDFMFEW